MPMKTWRMTGSTALGRGAEVELSVGTVRQPRNCLALVADDLLEQSSRSGAGVGVVRQEDHADAVVARAPAG